MIRNISKWFQEHEVMCLKIIRWIFFGVAISMLPFLFMLFRNWLSDLVAMELDYLPDLLLIIFAISAGAINLLWDDEKKISRTAKAICIGILAVVMLLCAATYASLFEQTIYNNKLLEAYDRLTNTVQGDPEDVINNPDYEKNMSQLATIKSIINETEPNPDKLKLLKIVTIVSLIVISIFGIVVEVINDRIQRRAEIELRQDGDSNPPDNGGLADPNKKDGE